MTRRVVDLFAGPGGWSEGARQLGIRDIGIEWDDAACRTRKAAGHLTIRADVAAYPTEPFVGKTWGLIASPPCQAWSMAGKRKGEQDRIACHQLAERMAVGDDSAGWIEWEDPRSRLVAQPVRWVRDVRPEWVALEQVPPVLGLWEHFERIFRRWGYRTWSGVLNAANYGVPQTRERAFLIASLVQPARPPMPTHAREPHADMFGADRLPWVTMAQALGWGFDTEPSCTVSSGGAATGGAEPFANQNYRRRLAAFVSAGVAGEGRPKDPETQPADTLTGKGTAYWIHERPATTVVGSFCPDVISPPGYRTSTSRQNAEGAVRVTVAEGGVLQSFPADYPWQGSRSKQYEQVGNAVPPLLAAHVLSAVTGLAPKCEVAA